MTQTKLVPTHEDLIRRLVLINEVGWVRGPKPADKEVGDVLEGLLGLTTNSLQDPDWGIHEVKAQRRGRSNPVSLLSKKPNYKGGLSAKEFVRQYGYDRHGQKALWIGLKPHKKDDKGCPHRAWLGTVEEWNNLSQVTKSQVAIFDLCSLCISDSLIKEPKMDLDS